MKSKSAIFFLALAAAFLSTKAQNSTFSPYSRYGLGEIVPSTFAHNSSMGGAYVALKPDSTFPVFINSGNPAAYALIKLTTLEVGGKFQFSNFKSGTTKLNKWGTNFSYAAVGFPIRNNGGACFGIAPYSYVGYETQNTFNQPSIGNVTYLYTGDGGLNKAFLGYGIMPFKNRNAVFQKRHIYIPDSLKNMGKVAFALRNFGSKVLSDFSLGFNANYLFGNISEVTKVIYPNSVLYNNTMRERQVNLGDFTGNFGAQTAITIDSVWDRKGRKSRIEAEIKRIKENADLPADFLKKQTGYVQDSVPLHKRALIEKVKLTFGYFSNINNSIKVNYSTAGYNYIVNSSGQEILRDTAYKNYDQKSTVTLPFEQGFGIGFKKGERLNIVADFAITNWSKFKFLNDVNNFKDNYRIAAGANYVPEKYATGRGSFYKRVNYRIGAGYNTGYINVNNTLISDYHVSLGLGIPVGANRYVSSMVNVGVQFGQMGTSNNSLVKENYWRVNFGFTFSDRWFQKFRYD
ncbi:MAG: hypothetical protein IT236_07670 [Bacteroidia bacterium]|nr:hypothetical protein [Bacteroidia bacterium]